MPFLGSCSPWESRWPLPFDRDVEVSRRSWLLPAALATAFGAFALTFRGPRDLFWQRMTRTGLALGTLSLVAEPGLRETRIRLKDVPVGLGSAAALYGIFFVGDRVARRILPKGGDQIGEMYALRELRPTPELAARLGLVIGPAEELFWRGFLQKRFADQIGTWPGAAIASAAYAGVHVAASNFTLFGAAGVAGAFWSALVAAGVPLGALIVSHIAWDLWIFLIAPTASSD